MSVLSDLRDAAVAAIAAGDYATALTKCEAAQVYISLTPNANHGPEGLQWRGTEIETLLKRLSQKAAATAAATSGGSVRHASFEEFR